MHLVGRHGLYRSKQRVLVIAADKLLVAEHKRMASLGFGGESPLFRSTPAGRTNGASRIVGASELVEEHKSRVEVIESVAQSGLDSARCLRAAEIVGAIYVIPLALGLRKVEL